MSDDTNENSDAKFDEMIVRDKISDEKCRLPDINSQIEDNMSDENQYTQSDVKPDGINQHSKPRFDEIKVRWKMSDDPKIFLEMSDDNNQKSDVRREMQEIRCNMSDDTHINSDTKIDEMIVRDKISYEKCK